MFEIKEKYVEDMFPRIHIFEDYLSIEGKCGNIYILNVEPINFKLRSEEEQTAILELYKVFLKRCDFDFQIIVQTEHTNVSNHIEEIKKCIEYESKIKNIAEGYMKLLKEISEVRGSISRKFYIVVNVLSEEKSKIDKVIEGLMLMRKSRKNL